MAKRWVLRLPVAAAVWIMTVVCTVTAYADRTLIPVGETVGIQIEMEGVLVAGVTPVETAEGQKNPAESAGLKAGDVIVAVNGQGVDDAAGLIEALDGCGGQRVDLTVRRDGRDMCLRVCPARDVNGGWRLGLWLRDGVAGIGTVTYVDPATGAFGALGHAVNDTETGVLVPVGSGQVCKAQIVDVKRGASGAPGELAGSFDAGDVIGCINSNTPCGIFGVIKGGLDTVCPALPVGTPADVQRGPATILACVAGQKIEEYDVEIARTGMASGAGRDLTVHVTDPDLLARTGGIVQGMSGSPIIQDGKLVGAVTHVCVIVFMPTGDYCFMGIFG